MSHSKMTLLGVALCGFAPWLALADGPAKRTPDQVLLVVNSQSPASLEIGGYYQEKRGVTNVVSISCPDSARSTQNESIQFSNYLQLIEQPIGYYLAAHTNIDFIVLTKGIPLRIRGSSMGSCDENNPQLRHEIGHRTVAGHPYDLGRPSVDSTLAALGYQQLPDMLKIDITGSGAVGFAYSNRYWNATGPFSHAKFGGYLVTRLDGYTTTDVKALIDRAQSSKEKTAGTILLDTQPKFGLGDKAREPRPIKGLVIPTESHWSDYNADMSHAHDVLDARGIQNELDLQEAFVGDRTNLMGYCSWGSNDARYVPQAYQTLYFAPGSMADTAVSTSARTFLPTTGGQSLLVDLITHGLTCGKGYVDEPLLQANASPTILFSRYTSGYCMAESFYAASRFVGWEDIVIGDPLCAPYAKP